MGNLIRCLSVVILLTLAQNALADARFSCSEIFEAEIVDTNFDEADWKAKAEKLENRFWDQHESRFSIGTYWPRAKEASRKAMLYFLQKNPVPARYAKDNETLSIAVSLIHKKSSEQKAEEIEKTLAAIISLKTSIAILRKKYSELTSDQVDEIEKIVIKLGEKEAELDTKESELDTLYADKAAIDSDIAKGLDLVEADILRMKNYEKELTLKIMNATNVLIELEYLNVAKKKFSGWRLDEAENEMLKKLKIKVVRMNRGREDKITITIPQLEADGTFGHKVITVFTRLGIDEHIRSVKSRRKEMFGGFLKRTFGGFGESVRQLEYDYGESFNRIRQWFRTIVRVSGKSEVKGDLLTLKNKLNEAMRSDHYRPSIRARSFIAYLMVVEEFKTRVAEANEEFEAKFTPATKAALGDKALATLKKKNGITDFTPLGFIKWIRGSVQTAIALTVTSAVLASIVAFNDKLVAGFWWGVDYVGESSRGIYYNSVPDGDLKRVEDIVAGFFQDEGTDPSVTFNSYIGENFPDVLLYRLDDLKYRQAIAAGDSSAVAPERPSEERLRRVWAMEVHFTMLMTIKEKQLLMATKTEAEQEEIRKQIKSSQAAIRAQVIKAESELQTIASMNMSIDRLSAYYEFFKNERGLTDEQIGPILAALTANIGGLVPEILTDADELELKIYGFLETYSGGLDMSGLPHEVSVDISSIMAYEVAIAGFKQQLSEPRSGLDQIRIDQPTGDYTPERGRRFLNELAGERVAVRFSEDAIVASIIAQIEAFQAEEAEAQ